MTTSKKLLVTLSLSACLAISAMAEETKLEDIEVNASAFDSQIKAISADQLEEEQASDIKDILKSMPNTIVDGDVRYGQKVYIRGLEDKFANITIDGAKMDGMLFHHQGDQSIDATLLKISEIELGANSAISGPGIVNGSFKYETKDPSDFLKNDEVFGGQVSLGVDSARQRKKASITLFGKVSEKVEVVGMYSSTDDSTLTKADGSKVKDKPGHLKSALGKVVFKPTDTSTLKFSINTYEDAGDRTMRGDFEGSADETDTFESTSRNTYTFKYDYNPSSELIDFKSTLYANKQWRTTEANTGGNQAGDTILNPETEYINSSEGFDIRNTSVLDIHSITYGVEYNKLSQEKDYKGLTTNVTQGTSVNNSVKGGEIDSYGLFIQDELRYNNLILTPGLRFDHHTLGGIFEEQSFSKLSPKFKAKYLASDELTFRFGFGKIFKGPALGETLFINSTTTAVADVGAQTGFNIEAGFDYDLTETLNADDAIFGLTLFRTKLGDYTHPSHNANLESDGDVETLGYEMMVSYNKDNFGLNANFTVNDVTRTDSDGKMYDASTSNIPTLKLSTNYNINSELKIGYGLEYVLNNTFKEKERSGDLVSKKRKSYHVHNATLSYKPSYIKDLSIYFGIDNLWNKDYKKHTVATSTMYASELGRNYKFTATYKF